MSTAIAASAKLEEYLASLYPTATPGDLLAYVKQPFCRRFGRASNLQWFAYQIRQLDRQGFDVYLTINALDGRSIRRRGQKTRGTEAEVTAVVGLVADIDAAGKAGHNYPTQPFILNALAALPLAPSIIVVSGKANGGLHVYWLLATPFVIRIDEDRSRIKGISERWQRLLKAKLAPYDLDSTFDLVRVLHRSAPTTTNTVAWCRCSPSTPSAAIPSKTSKPIFRHSRRRSSTRPSAAPIPIA